MAMSSSDIPVHRHRGPLGETVERQFSYSGRFADGRRETGLIAIRSPELAIDWLMKRRFCNATVMECMPDGRRVQMGGISQARKGARRLSWWDNDLKSAPDAWDDPRVMAGIR
jgi:hypothetical protein